MNKKVVDSILKHTLMRSPKSATHIISQILKPMDTVSNKRINHYSYIDSLISQFSYDLLVSQQFHVWKEHQTIQYNLFHLVRSNGKEKSQNSIQKLIFLIQKLERNEQQVSIYSDIQNLIGSMDGEEVQKVKNNLFYLHKWTLRSQKKENEVKYPNYIKKKRLRDFLVKRLASAYLNNILHSEVFEQIQKRQLQAKAALLFQQKKYMEGIAAYENIYEDKNNNQTTRMKALQSLCGYCFWSGDLQYLRKMTVRLIEEKCGQKHIDYIQKILRQAEVLKAVWTIAQQGEQSEQMFL